MSATHRFFDGKIARPRTVSFAVRADAMEIVGEDGAIVAAWPLSDIHVADQNAVSGAYLLRLGADEPARLEIAKGPDLDALLAQYPRFRRWRARERGRLFKGFMIWGATGAAALAALYFGWTKASVLAAEWIPPAWEERIGASVEETWFPEAKRCTGAAGLQALQALGDRLWPEQDPDHKVKLFILEVGETNAFAVPGRRIVVFSGLIKRAKNPEMLAGVLAHEMGHVDLHHPMRGLIHQLGLGAVVTMVFGDSSMAGMGQMALALSYSREMEREADQRGIERLQRAGIRADGMAAFFAEIKKDVAGSMLSDLPEFLSSHPDLDARIAATQQPPTGGPAMSDAEWQALRKACDSK